MSKMIEIDGVELSVDTVKSALEKAGVKLEKKVDWRKLDLGTVVKGNRNNQAVVFYDTAKMKKGLCWIFNCFGKAHDLVTIDGILSDFDNCKVIGKIKFVVEEI